jgi:hypothetical protein
LHFCQSFSFLVKALIDMWLRFLSVMQPYRVFSTGNSSTGRHPFVHQNRCAAGEAKGQGFLWDFKQRGTVSTDPGPVQFGRF